MAFDQIPLVMNKIVQISPQLKPIANSDICFRICISGLLNIENKGKESG